jgi:uncharacterized protein YggE
MRRAICNVTIVAVLAVLAPATFGAQADSPVPTITVSGSASLRVPPDRVSFSVGVVTQAAAVAQAFDSNKRKLEAVVAALRGKGVQAKEIQTANLDISSHDAEGKKLLGYRVSTRVTVTRSDTNGVAELLQAAIGAGANQASGLSFSVAEPSQFQSRGLELAFKDARAKAEALAGLAQRSLGAVVSVTENVPWARSNQSNNLAGLGYVDGGVQSGSEQVPFAITVVFELK